MHLKRIKLRREIEFQLHEQQSGKNRLANQLSFLEMRSIALLSQNVYLNLAPSLYCLMWFFFHFPFADKIDSSTKMFYFGFSGPLKALLAHWRNTLEEFVKQKQLICVCLEGLSDWLNFLSKIENANLIGFPSQYWAFRGFTFGAEMKNLISNFVIDPR